MRCLGQPGKRREVLLANYHVELPKGAYWSASPVFVHADPGRCPRFVEKNEVPKAIRDLELVGMRSYDVAGRMLYDLTGLSRGEDAHARVESLLVHSRTAYVNIHTSGPGCYLCRVERL
jgi:hypothetical protein